MSRSRPRTTVADERSPLSGEGQCSRGCSKQARPDGDIRAGRVDRRGGGWGRTRRSQPCSFRGRVLRWDRWAFFFLIPLRLLRPLVPLVAAAAERVQRPRRRRETARNRPRCRPWSPARGAGHRCDGATRSWYRAAPLLTMPSNLAHAPAAEIRVRKAERGDLDALTELEHRVFATDRLSRRSLRRFLSFAERGGDRGAGGRPARRHRHRAVSAALGRRASLFDRGRAPHGRARGGADAARGRRSRPRSRAAAARSASKCTSTNHAAIARYRKSGYREFGRHRGYYEDGGDALRFEKRLVVRPARARGGAALFSPDHRIHLRAGLHHDGAGLGRSKVQAGARLRVPALARSHHHLHELGTGRLRALRHGGRAQAPRPRAGGLCQPPRPLFPRHRQVRRQAPGHAADPTRVPACRRRRSLSPAT